MLTAVPPCTSVRCDTEEVLNAARKVVRREGGRDAERPGRRVLIEDTGSARCE